MSLTFILMLMLLGSEDSLPRLLLFKPGLSVQLVSEVTASGLKTVYKGLFIPVRKPFKYTSNNE